MHPFADQYQQHIHDENCFELVQNPDLEYLARLWMAHEAYGEGQDSACLL